MIKIRCVNETNQTDFVNSFERRLRAVHHPRHHQHCYNEITEYNDTISRCASQAPILIYLFFVSFVVVYKAWGNWARNRTWNNSSAYTSICSVRPPVWRVFLAPECDSLETFSDYRRRSIENEKYLIEIWLVTIERQQLPRYSNNFLSLNTFECEFSSLKFQTCSDFYYVSNHLRIAKKIASLAIEQMTYDVEASRTVGRAS